MKESLVSYLHAIFNFTFFYKSITPSIEAAVRSDIQRMSKIREAFLCEYEYYVKVQLISNEEIENITEITELKNLTSPKQLHSLSQKYKKKVQTRLNVFNNIANNDKNFLG